jgi:FAD/FMN-containing dehydrogenase
MDNAIARLQEALPRQIVAQGHPSYDARRAVLFDAEGCRPAALVRVTSAADVAAAVRLAQREGLRLAVRCGGHSSAGHSTVDGGVVIDLRELNAVEVDEANGTVWAGGGARVGEVLRALAPHGLAIGFGDSPDVGIGGLVTGGGVGYLSRLCGATVDSVLAAEVVLADGRIVEASADSEPELFWAIRGGGGNFGVLTRIKFQARAVHEFTGGMMVIPATAGSIARFTAAAKAAPDALGTIAAVMPAPPAPFIPPHMQGQMVIFAMLSFAGPDAEAAAVYAPFRALGPVFDTVQAGPYYSLYEGDNGEPEGLPVSRTWFVDGVDQAAAQTMLDALNASDATMRMIQIRVLGGAVNRIPAGSNAYAHRRGEVLLMAMSFYGTEEQRRRYDSWAHDLMTAVPPSVDGAYVNFLGAEGEEATRSAYPGETWDRLRAIKRSYDPTNLFRRNQNIPPAP